MGISISIKSWKATMFGEVLLLANASKRVCIQKSLHAQHVNSRELKAYKPAIKRRVLTILGICGLEQTSKHVFPVT